MAEYITREEVCKLCNNKKEHCGREKCPVYIAPTVDAVPVVHGRWINKTESFVKDEFHIYTTERVDCSVCEHIFWHESAMTYNYCPHCGAKMDGGNEDGNL